MVKPQRDDSVRLELTLTQEQMDLLIQTKYLLSHKFPDGKWADVITYLAEKHVKKIFGKGFEVESSKQKLTQKEMQL